MDGALSFLLLGNAVVLACGYWVGCVVGYLQAMKEESGSPQSLMSVVTPWDCKAISSVIRQLFNANFREQQWGNLTRITCSFLLLQLHVLEGKFI